MSADCVQGGAPLCKSTHQVADMSPTQCSTDTLARALGGGWVTNRMVARLRVVSIQQIFTFQAVSWITDVACECVAASGGTAGLEMFAQFGGVA